MSKALMNSAIGGAVIAGAVVVAVATGLIDLGKDTGADEAAKAPADPSGQMASVAPEAGPDTGPEMGSEAGPEATPGSDSGSDSGPVSAAEAGDKASVDTVAPQADTTSVEPEAEATADVADAEQAETTATDERVVAPAIESAPQPPRFDTVRAAPGGSTLIAGAGEPGAEVEVLVGGEPATSTKIGNDGNFVAFVDLPSEGAASVLTLRMRAGTGSAVMSEREVIVIPASVTQTVALASPQAGGAPEALQAPEAPTAPALSGLAAMDAAPQTGSVPGGPTSETGPDATASAVPMPSAGGAPESLAAPKGEAAPAGRDGFGAPGVAALSAGAVAGIAGAADAVPSAGTETTASPTVLMAGPDGIEAMPATPLLPGDVALDSISYDNDGEVHIAGRGEDTAFVRVYLDNTPVTTSRIREDGRWKVQLPEVDSGTYMLRVDQVDASGQVLARVESPFLREDPALLAGMSQGTGPFREITVQPGHTLWAISKDRYGDGVQYLKIFRANADRIRNPDLIYPGQIFDLPDEVVAE
ncbi:LysM peptidoglycan-binding domain-containing protein [Sagittula sp. S175]|uniref:LysM peptidoglycan-binding domain-containing protein n=1 Tax=Sagittula sp. S175 TaxID=3415129 RepID=UPI003C7CB983